MILKSLRLENIRSYLSETIVFPEGSVLLSGDIGSGKSTILLGIEFALFGIMRAELSGFSLLRHGKNQGSVELKFDIDGKEYLIKRTLKKSKDTINQDSGYIIMNGKKFEGTPIELKSKILEILGYPEELITKSKSMIYRYTVYTPQEEMKQILFEDKEIRLDTLRKLFGIDKYKTIRENADNFTRELRRNQSELSIRLESFEETEKEKNEMIEKTEIISKKIAEDQHLFEKIKENTKKEKMLFEKIENEIKEYNEIKKNLAIKESMALSKINNKESLFRKKRETEKHLEGIEKKILLFNDINEIKPEKEIEMEISKLQEEYSTLIKVNSVHSEKINSIDKQIKTLEEEIQELSEKSKEMILLKSKLQDIEEKLNMLPEQKKLLEEFQDKEKKAQISLEKINSQKTDSLKIISTIKNAEVCPTCNQIVDETHKNKVIKEENEKIKAIDSEKNKINDGLKKITLNIEKIKRNIDKLSDIEKEYRKEREKNIILEEYSKQLIKKQKEVSTLFEKKKEIQKIIEEREIRKEEEFRKSIEKKKKILADCRDNNMKFREKKNLSENINHERKNIEKIDEEISSLEKEEESLNLEKQDLEKKLIVFGDINEKMQKQKDKFEELKENLKEIEITLASLNQEKTSYIQQISLIEKKIISMEKIKSKIKEISEIEHWFDEFFVNLMSNMEKHIMVSIHKEFEALLKEWFYILIEEVDISLDDEFSVKLTQDGYETSVDNLSGGEKTSVALAYRLALNKVINDLISNIKTKDFIILDEPTDGFSTEQLDKVRDILHELDMKQTIIVSHEQKMESYVENTIRIVKTENISRVFS